MDIKLTAIPDVLVVEMKKHEDERGSFMRLFCQQELSTVLGARKIVQINKSVTISKGAIRGLHFQCPPYAEMKLVRCLKGQVFDVAVDLRQKSKTFLQWHSEILTPGNNKMLLIPEGFAHGFQSLECGTEVLYLHTAEYHPESEAGVLFDDPKLNIQWPIDVTDVSDRDKNHPLIDEHFMGLYV